MLTFFKDKLDLFVANYEKINKAFKLDFNYMQLASALLYTSSDVEVNIERLKECDSILKENEGIFSELRGFARLPLISKMDLSNEPRRYLERTKEIYRELSHNKIIGNAYRVLAAMTTYDYIQNQSYLKTIDKTNEIYKIMEEEHPFLTSFQDLPLAALLAVSGLNVDYLIEEMEINYQLLKSEFFSNDAVQSLSHVLALMPGTPEKKCAKVLEIYDELKLKKHKYGGNYELALLGLLADLPLSPERIADELISAEEYLKQFNGLGDFMLGKKMRMMYASQMLYDCYSKEYHRENGLKIANSMAVSIAMEICIMVCITTTSAAATH